ncbi:MAG: 4Fe-4S binding protein [Peptococcaceae bacterium]|nr:4Fe-4S binding protein [Peptococcaceae bacterium]
MPPVFDLEKCKGCGKCEDLCMMDALSMEDNGAGKKIPHVKYPDECWHCGACRMDCPEQAISIVFPPHMLTV